MKCFPAIAVFLILLGGVALAESSEPPPQTPSIKTEQQTDGALKGQSNPSEQTKGRADTAVGQDEPRTASEAKGHDQPKEGTHEASEFWTVGSRSLKITDTLLVAFTFLLFLATVALFWATRDLVHDANENAQQQLRAYIYIKEASADFRDGQIWSANITFRNFGQTPAYEVRTPTGFFISVKADRYDFGEPPSDMVASANDLGPGQEIHMIARAGRVFTLQETASIRSGGSEIFLHGTVSYKDAFGFRRFTKFSLRYAPVSGAFEASPEGRNKSN